MSRAESWERLGSEAWDLVIIGGGVTGVGAFREAARRGLKVALVEAHDFAFGTSSRSSKLVHGGLRYLENKEFSLVFEAVSERRVLMNIAPHLVQPLPFLFPVYQDSKVGLTTLRAGMWLYDALALFRAPKNHTHLNPTAVSKKVPELSQEGLKGAPLYYDCSTDDARLTLETLLDGIQGGGEACNYAWVEGLSLDEQGRVQGVKVLDRLGELAPLELSARTVINATGPWTDLTRKMGGREVRDVLRPTKGVHIVLDAKRFPLDCAVVHSHPEDGRVLFSIPWGDRTYVGTTDTDYDDDPAQVAADRSDVDYLLAALNHYFPSLELGYADVVSTWAGLRPLIHQEGSESTISREHEIFVGENGLITIAGGKLTTYRRMGAEVVRRALEMMALLGGVPEDIGESRTGREPLPGAVGWPENDQLQQLVESVQERAEGRLSAAQAGYLAAHYGTRALDIAELACARDLCQPLVQGRPEILAEVDWAVEQELAQTLNDLLIRRTQIYFRDHEQGLGAVQQVAERMGKLLGWDEARRERELERYRDEVALSRRWREELPAEAP